MQVNVDKTDLLLQRRKLLDILNDFVDVISKDHENNDGMDLINCFVLMKEALNNLDISTAQLEDRLKKCSCSGKKLFCLISVIARTCSLLLKEIAVVHNNILDNSFIQDNNDVEFSVQQKQHIATILQYVVCNGMMGNLEFCLSIVVINANEGHSCGERDLFECCRCLITMCNYDELRSIFLSKHLLALVGSLLQLSYSPSSAQIMSKEEIGFCQSSISKLITKWSQLKDFVKCLLIIQGSDSRSTPSWLCKACGFLLSKCLLRQTGVASVISALLSTFDCKMSPWKKAEVTSNLLSTPQRLSHKEDYYSSILSQIYNLFQSRALEVLQDDEEKLFIQTLVATVLLIFKKSPDLAKRHFFNKLFRPLSYLYSYQEHNFAEEGSHTGIVHCIEILHELFVLFKHPCRETVLKDVLLPHILGLFAVFCGTRDTVSHIQSLLQQLLVKCLDSVSSDSAALLLLYLCGIRDVDHAALLNSIKTLPPGITFSLDRNQEIIVTFRDISSRLPEDVISDQNLKVQSFIDLMNSSKIERLPTKILISLLKHVEDSDEDLVNTENDKLLTREEKASLHLHSGESRLLTFAILTSMIENADPNQLFSDVSEICSFIKVILTKISALTHHSEEDRMNVDSLKICLAVLGLCLINPLTSKQQKAMQELVPLLQKIASSDEVAPNDKEVASDLAVAIATHGASASFDLESFSKTLQDQVKKMDEVGRNECEASTRVNQEFKTKREIDSVKKQLIVELPEAVSDSEARQTTTTDKKRLSDSENKHKHSVSLSPPLTYDSAKIKDREFASNDLSVSSLDDLISNAYDSCPAIRAAAIRSITNGLKSGDTVVVGKVEKLHEIFAEILLKEEDSFVYLSAIQGLVETINKTKMVGENASNLFDQLVEQYSRRLESHDNEAEVQFVKLGEVLLRVARELGEIAEYQSRKLLPVLLRGACDKRSQIRTSCISNLADLCPLLRHKLTTFQHELTECICATAISDNDVSVRRAAIYLLKRLLESLDASILQIFPHSLRRFYSVLKTCYDDGRDDVIRLHAQLALEKLDAIMRDVMFNDAERMSRTPHKKITIIPDGL